MSRPVEGLDRYDTENGFFHSKTVIVTEKNVQVLSKRQLGEASKNGSPSYGIHIKLSVEQTKRHAKP